MTGRRQSCSAPAARSTITSRLRPVLLQRLLDLGASGVPRLGRLVRACSKPGPRRPRTRGAPARRPCWPWRGSRGLGARGVHDLYPLALGLLAETTDLGLLLVEIHLLLTDFLLGAADCFAAASWASRSIVSANSAAARTRCRRQYGRHGRTARSSHSGARPGARVVGLERGHVPPERVERLLHLAPVVPSVGSAGPGPRHRREAGASGRGPVLASTCSLLLPSAFWQRAHNKYALPRRPDRNSFSPCSRLGTQLDSELLEQFLLHLAGAPLIGSTPAWFLGNAITSRRFASRRRAISIPLDPEGDPAVRRRAHRKRVEEEAELRPLLVPGPRPQRVEDGSLQLGLVDPERAAADLDPVHDHVVGERLGGAWIPIRDELLRPRSSAG